VQRQCLRLGLPGEIVRSPGGIRALHSYTTAVHAGRAYGTHYVFTDQARAGASRGGPRLD